MCQIHAGPCTTIARWTLTISTTHPIAAALPAGALTVAGAPRPRPTPTAPATDPLAIEILHIIRRTRRIVATARSRDGTAPYRVLVDNIVGITLRTLHYPAAPRLCPARLPHQQPKYHEPADYDLAPPTHASTLPQTDPPVATISMAQSHSHTPPHYQTR